MKCFYKRFRLPKTSLLFLSLLILSPQLYSQAHSHDPSRVMKDGDRYWVFKTADGIGAMSATNADFSYWQSEPSVFGNTWPEWINDYVPDFAGLFWAPSCIYMNGKYYLYYSCSTMGSSLSAIGVATTPSINDSAWTDQGMVVYSNGSGSGTLNNAIDPALFKDDDGRVWMTYGSWFGGITLTEIDSVTGKAKGSLTQLAGGNHTDIEAPYLMKNGSSYYLFVNRGLCCNGVNSTYYIQVGKSVQVTGPYEDWRTFLKTDGRWIGPGHVGYNEGRLGYHVYDRDNEGATAYMNTTLSWVNGWPVAGKVSQESQGDFIVEGTYRIFTNDTAKVLAVANNTPAKLSNIEIQDYSSPSLTGQSWDINNTCFNANYLTPKDYSSLSLEILNCAITDSANIDLWTYWEGECQQWIFHKLTDNAYQIKSNLSNKCLEIEGNAIANGSNVMLNSCDTANKNQHFKLELIELAEEITNTDSFPVVISYTSEQCGNSADNILDGSTASNSRWSTRGFPKSVVIDYGEVKAFTCAKVYTYQNRAYQYTVELDKYINFSNPYTIDRTSNTSTSQPITNYFDTVNARYARLTVIGAASSSIEWVGITEFELSNELVNINDMKVDNNSVTMYPNPVEDILNIDISLEQPTCTNVKIYNITGQVVLDKTINTQYISLSLADLNSGMYNVIISNDQVIACKRFIKK